ncbi:hypothetical protein E4U49_000228, partial [Claviceps purpurea]
VNAPIYLPKCSYTIRSWIIDEFRTKKRTLQDELAEAVSKISISFDAWTAEINIISRNFVLENKIPVYDLGTVGFKGLQMINADGRLNMVPHFVSMTLVCEGVKRTIWAVVTPDSQPKHRTVLILGLPWLHDVGARFDIRGRLRLGIWCHNSPYRPLDPFTDQCHRHKVGDHVETPVRIDHLQPLEADSPEVINRNFVLKNKVSRDDVDLGALICDRLTWTQVEHLLLLVPCEKEGRNTKEFGASSMLPKKVSVVGGGRLVRKVRWCSLHRLCTKSEGDIVLLLAWLGDGNPGR